MNIPLSPSLIVAKRQTQEIYRSLAADDARQGKPPNPLAGIDPYWIDIYNQSYQQTLTQLQSPNSAQPEQDIPF